jgi:hypothetical protein
MEDSQIRECILQAYTDGISLYRGLKDYFEFYNTRRLHQSLDYGTLIIILQKKWHKIRITFFGFLNSKVISIFKIIEYQTKTHLKSLRFLSEKWVQHRSSILFKLSL